MSNLKAMKRILNAITDLPPITKDFAARSPAIGPDGEFVNDCTVRSEAMSDTKERKPLPRDYTEREYERPLLVIDSDLHPYTVTENGMAGENKYRMLRRLRHFYEELITTGKLRVVEEVAANLEPMANEVTGASWHEMSCCGYVIEGMEPGDPVVFAPGIAYTFNYCPGCGNKIKR